MDGDEPAQDTVRRLQKELHDEKRMTQVFLNAFLITVVAALFIGSTIVTHKNDAMTELRTEISGAESFVKLQHQLICKATSRLDEDTRNKLVDWSTPNPDVFLSPLYCSAEELLNPAGG